MPNRITGLNSGLDTESLVTSLVAGYQKKVDTLQGNQKRHEWKQEAWKNINSSYTKFYNGPLDTMSMKSSFMKKTTTSTNSSAVSIKTKDGAMNPTQKMKVNRIASSAFTTGGKVSGAADGGATKLSSLEGVTKSEYTVKVPKYQTDSEGNEVLDANGNKIQETDENGQPVYTTETRTGYNITISVGKVTTNEAGEITSRESADTITLGFDDDATIDDVMNAIKAAKFENSDARFNANFDAAQGRVYMSASATGNDGNFEFVGGNTSLATALGLTSDAIYNAGSDAEIELNGVKYENGSGTFEINGLQITANEVSDQEFTITTKTDTSGIYDMVKDLISQYNEMIKSLDKAYYADSSQKYKMLTDDERYAMSDKEVEEWDKKIKDGLLSKDSTLYEAANGVKALMQSAIDVTLADGTKKKMYLSDFGINTGSYLTTAKDERGVLHIDGDKDDLVSKSNTDKLQAMIDADPDAVADFFSKLAQNLRSTMFNQMKGTEFSSSFTIYEDKLMAQQYSSYNSQITAATERLNKKQDAYYAKFAQMEKAMAKINSVQQNLGGYFGG
ncbi:MAG: flagellar filament capping protein FliD [Lachnospiraceae bacterium]|nr:flagellar filament capping protein FliD [Lachnospiraceae bacterium]